MATCRTVVNGALRKLGRLAAGREPRTADATDALSALSSLYNSWIASGAFGRLVDVVPTGTNFTAFGNQRIMREDATTLTVELPELISDGFYSDYGWHRDGGYYGTTITITDLGGGDVEVDVAASQPIGPCVTSPKDGAPVISTDRVGGQIGSWIYDGTLKRWQSIDGLTLDAEAPRSQANPEGLAAVLAMEIADQFGVDVSPMTMRQASIFNQQLTSRFGMRRQDVPGVYV